MARLQKVGSSGSRGSTSREDRAPTGLRERFSPKAGGFCDAPRSPRSPRFGGSFAISYVTYATHSVEVPLIGANRRPGVTRVRLSFEKNYSRGPDPARFASGGARRGGAGPGKNLDSVPAMKFQRSL